jgi:hypothetical protein
MKTLAAASAASAFIDASWFAAARESSTPWIDPATAHDWLARWEKSILDRARNRYCDKEMGEELGWLVSPFLEGAYYGYLATHDLKWVEVLIDWTDSCLKRGVKEPDGFIGWPKVSDETEGFDFDSMLGEAMMLRPVVLMADETLRGQSRSGLLGWIEPYALVPLPPSHPVKGNLPKRLCRLCPDFGVTLQAS